MRKVKITVFCNGNRIKSFACSRILNRKWIISFICRVYEASAYVISNHISLVNQLRLIPGLEIDSENSHQGMHDNEIVTDRVEGHSQRAAAWKVLSGIGII